MHWEEGMTHVLGGTCAECGGFFCKKEWCRHECVPISVRLNLDEGSKNEVDLKKKEILDARIKTIVKEAGGEEFHSFNEKLIFKAR